MGFPSSQQVSAAGLAGQIGGGLTSAIGSYFGASNQKLALNAQANLTDVNARIADLAADSSLAAGQQKVGMQTLKAGQLKSAQRAAMAANGVDLGTGSAAEVLASTDTVKEIDANTLTANAVREAWGYRVAATNMRNDALMRRAGAKGISPLMAAGTSLLGSAGGVASSWYRLNKEGALDGTIFGVSGD